MVKLRVCAGGQGYERMTLKMTLLNIKLALLSQSMEAGNIRGLR